MPHTELKTDLLKVFILNIAAFGISLTELEMLLRIFSILLAITYTGYKFWKDTRK